MKKKDYIDIILQESNKEEKKENKSVWGKKFKRILIKLWTVLTIKVIIAIILTILIFFPVFIIIWLFLWLSWSDKLSSNSWNYNIDWNVFISSFSEDNLDTPMGIPVERWIISYWFDYNKYKNSLIKRFLKLSFYNAKEYYSWHRWVDFARTYKDKVNWYNPYILSTLRGIIKQSEYITKRSWSNIEYKKIIYSRQWNVEYKSSINKISEVRLKPYWNYIMISSLDWKFYVLFAHLENLNKDVLKYEKIWRGNILWKMGTTWNSTWIHLHYEIRYCWNNPSIEKTWQQCTPLNPLGSIIWNENTFLWFSRLPKVNEFVAWNIETIKNKTKTEEEIYEEIRSDYKKFCSDSKLLFVGEEITCKEAFPIFHMNKDNTLFPNINDSSDKENIWKEYIENEYKIKWIPDIKEINEIRKIEWIKNKIYTARELYIKVWHKFSRGKYLNKNKYYLKIYKDDLEEVMIKDTIKTLSLFKEKWNKTEDIYNKYYHNTAYDRWSNPYVYNMLNSNKIFMDILDEKWEFISKYNNYWALTIFKNLEQ